GILLAFHALERSSVAIAQLADAAVAGRQMRLFLTAAARQPSSAGVGASAAAAPARESWLIGRDLRYRYVGRDELVLDGCDVEVPSQTRMLLDGPSGAGKSTLAAVMAGLRQ